MATITAKYAGRCAITGARIIAGDLIEWSRGRAVLIKRAPSGVASITLIGDQGPKTFYRNNRGRCIDAPCCGCCTI
jgi:hypothetical protein